jgi:hypothetical protein
MHSIPSREQPKKTALILVLAGPGTFAAASGMLVV